MHSALEDGPLRPPRGEVIVRAACYQDDDSSFRLPKHGVHLWSSSGIASYQDNEAGRDPATGRLFTVFSATDYPEASSEKEMPGNSAAILQVGRNSRLYPRILQHTAAYCST